MFKRHHGDELLGRPAGFNPSVGILGVQAGIRSRTRGSKRFVSIPQSGFWVFKPAGGRRGLGSRRSFNPSVGILGVQAVDQNDYSGSVGVFQSLSRDSGCSSPYVCRGKSVGRGVSIPRSGFWVFKPVERRFNLISQICFNPSVGILGVQARQQQPGAAADPQFQSLGRDSGCSSSWDWLARKRSLVVSIPRSGFWVFKRSGCSLVHSPVRSFNPSVGILGVQAAGAEARRGHAHAVSIPRSGFWVFKRKGSAMAGWSIAGFNPSVGILGVQAFCRGQTGVATSWFQSLGRDSGCSSRQPGHRARRQIPVSIPRSGFWVFKPEYVGGDYVYYLVSIPRSGFWVFKPDDWQ